MRAVDIIRKKRDGGALTRDEIAFFVSGFTEGRVTDYQASALAMAVYFRGMTPEETLALTESMMRTGQVLDLSALPGPKVDKHSTGGVGDKTSLVLAPLAAVCGVSVPMISGRGLGHTGGTLDKLESIPGFRVALPLEEFRSVLGRARLAFIGQTPEIAPADRKLYALRDVTATVESRPLIAASIMSKKMAEGIDALVLDVKTGDGAFMKTLDDSRALAQAMVDIGRGMGRKVAALITDMEQPLGRAVGNALEVAECVDTLRGEGPKDLEVLSVELAAWMLHLAAEEPLDAARGRVREALRSGAGLQKLREVIALQGGDPAVCDDTSRLPRAARKVEVRAEAAGRVTAIRCASVGAAAMILGAGRETMESAIDPAVGLVVHKKVGDAVAADEPVVTLHVNDARRLKEADHMIRTAIRIGAGEARPAPLLREVIQ